MDRVNKLSLKRILPLLILIVFVVPLFTYSLLDRDKKSKDEKIYQENLQKDKIKKEARDAEEKKYLLGEFEPSERNDFSIIPKEYTTGGNKMYLRNETLVAFYKMRESAIKNGIELKILSATRNFNYQKNLWNDKWSGATIVEGQNLSKSITDGLERFKKILEYSAVPGMSRHHWGTDIDINEVNPSYFNGEKGRVEYDWLKQNAWVFGFCEPYNLKGGERPTGHNGEKWHWSYYPLANTFYKEYKDLIKEEDIKGFMGDQYVVGQNLIDEYVLSINPDCFKF